MFVNLSRSLCLISLSTWTSLHLISLSLVLAPAAGSDAQCGRLGVGGGCGLPGIDRFVATDGFWRARLGNHRAAAYNTSPAGRKPSEHEPGPSSREATAPGSFLQNFPLADGIQTRVVRALKQVQLNV